MARIMHHIYVHSGYLYHQGIWDIAYAPSKLGKNSTSVTARSGLSINVTTLRARGTFRIYDLASKLAGSLVNWLGAAFNSGWPVIYIAKWRCKPRLFRRNFVQKLGLRFIFRFKAHRQTCRRAPRIWASGSNPWLWKRKRILRRRVTLLFSTEGASQWRETL